MNVNKETITLDYANTVMEVFVNYNYNDCYLRSDQ